MEQTYDGALHRVACAVLRPLGVNTEKLRIRVTPARTEALIAAIQARERLNTTLSVALSTLNATAGGPYAIYDFLHGGDDIELDPQLVAHVRKTLEAAEEADHAAMSWAAREIARDMDGVKHPGKAAYPRTSYPRPRELA